MPKAKHYNVEGTMVGELDLPEALFGAEPNEHVVWEAVKTYLSNRRQGTAATKTRSLVSGGNSKPWRQKGTGRARQGSTRATQWVGGATVFGPTPRSYSARLPKKIRRLAMVSALSRRAQDGNVAVVDRIEFETPKTGTVARLLENAGLGGRKICFVTQGSDMNMVKSCRNLPGVKVLPHSAMNVYDLIEAEVVAFTPGALEGIKEVFGS